MAAAILLRQSPPLKDLETETTASSGSSPSGLGLPLDGTMCDLQGDDNAKKLLEEDLEGPRAVLLSFLLVQFFLTAGDALRPKLAARRQDTSHETAWESERHP